MLKKLKTAFEKRQKKEKKFEKSFARLEAVTEQYLATIRK